MVNHLDNLLLMYNITEKEWYTKKINNAMVRHLGQSKPRDATQTAQTSFHRNYDLISPGLPDEKLLYGRAKIAERKLTMKAVGSWDDYSKIKSWKTNKQLLH